MLSKEQLEEMSPEELVEHLNNLSLESSSPSSTESCGSVELAPPMTSNLQTNSACQGGPGSAEENSKNTDKSNKTIGTSHKIVKDDVVENVVNVDYASINRSLSNDSSNNGAPLFDGLDIKDPVELLVLLDEDIRNGETKLHPWQITMMLDFANDKHTKDSPFQCALQACNSSGKDKYAIAACAVWLCMRYRDTYCPITSSSGAQLEKQTCMHIRRLCDKANVLFGGYGLKWDILQRNFKFLHIDENGKPCTSEIVAFATDEAGKAEGYHPVEKGKKMAIFTSETKSIPNEITDALERCTGFTHRVDASSPGAAAGYFYNICSTAIPRHSISDIKELDSTQIILYKITAFDCPHITSAEIKRFAAKQPGGINSIVYRSSILAEFGSTDELVVIPSDFVWKSVEGTRMFCNVTWIQEQTNDAGLDLSMGGAETVLCIRKGNKLIGMEYANIEDTDAQLEWLDDLFGKWHLNNPVSKIRGDYVGIGGPILRILKKRYKWNNIIFVDSRNKASDSKTYKNRGTELFFHVRSLFEKRHIIIPQDKVLIEQLCSRHYKIIDGKLHQLLSKQEEKNKGYPSPDRADAFNLCFWGYERDDIIEDEKPAPFITPETKNEFNEKACVFDMKSWANRNKKMYQPDHIDIKELNENGLLEEINFYNQHRTTHR